MSFSREHGVPHFNAIYGDSNAVFAIETLDLIEGRLPNRAHRLVREWAAEHQGEEEHEFTIPWLAVRGFELSLWIVSERFHSPTNFERAFVRNTKERQVYVKTQHHERTIYIFFTHS